jgi:Ca2+-binding EF-hand superfamily protein
LEKHEFAACLKALGQNIPDEAVERLIGSIGKAVPGKINFQEFVEYM